MYKISYQWPKKEAKHLQDYDYWEKYTYARDYELLWTFITVHNYYYTFYMCISHIVHIWSNMK